MISVPGIGPVIVTELLLATNEMQAINDPKKLACHARVAPFAYRSGSSIRGRTKVSYQARKRLKALIHLAGRPVPHHIDHPGNGRPSGLLCPQVEGGQAENVSH
ncbi:IS110 family transposase [Spirosoma foliorum]|uniref:IS110 family transposase n=1 Tax=Spirosoma foliorum TaxID=2710596 RepID=UPI001F0AC270|nr:IS110 family transposase [Spirosoma foliorum]